MRRFLDPIRAGAAFLLTLTLSAGVPVLAQDEGAQGASEAVPEELDRAELERQFEETMSGSRLEGKFNVLRPDGESAPMEELYMVSDLSRGDGDTWVFTSKMKYGQNEIKIPVPTEVKWAGDTAVITLTDQPIEGLQGSFTARVMIYKDRYAGTWQHGPVGGHMWGRIVKAEAETEAPPAPQEESDEEPR